MRTRERDQYIMSFPLFSSVLHCEQIQTGNIILFGEVLLLRTLAAVNPFTN